MKDCPVCDCYDCMIESKVVQTFTYKTAKLEVPGYIIFTCMQCGETFGNEEQFKSLEPAIRDLHKRGNAGLP